MNRQDLPLSGLTPATQALSGNDLILLTQNTPNGLQSVSATLAQLLQYLFFGSGETDSAITDLGYLKEVATGGLLEGNGKANNPLNVKLSAMTGNLLQSRSDGLYYGIEAPTDISVLYVDSLLGDDNNNNNNGLSPASPFKTLGKALSLVTGAHIQTINLKCGNDRPAYIVDRGVRLSETAKLTLRAYGDPYLDGEIFEANVKLIAPNDEFRLYHSPSSVPIQRPKLVSSFTTPDPINGVILNGLFDVYGQAQLIFNNIDIRLRAIDPNNNPFLESWTASMFHAVKDSKVQLEFCYITDDRRNPEVADGGRNIMLNTRASGTGSASVILAQTQLRVISPDRSPTDYAPIFSGLNSLNQLWISYIYSGFNIEYMVDNIYPIMKQYGENSVIANILRDDYGDVISPISDYQHFSRPQWERNLNQTGYAKFPNGLIMQWGRNNYTAYYKTTIYFPIVFPNGCLNVFCNAENSTGNIETVNQSAVNSASFNWAGVQIYWGGSWDNAPTTGYWMALGY